MGAQMGTSTFATYTMWVLDVNMTTVLFNDSCACVPLCARCKIRPLVLLFHLDQSFDLPSPDILLSTPHRAEYINEQMHPP